MKHRNLVFAVILVILLSCSILRAVPVTADDARTAVTGWLKLVPEPLETNLGREVATVETFTDDLGEPVYHIVYLQPSGFVIVAADDLVEPIIGFADDGTYDPASDNPLASLVTNDLNTRISEARGAVHLMAAVPQTAETKQKWSYLLATGRTSNDEITLLDAPAICSGALSDVRVPPLLQSKWGQSNYKDSYGQSLACYNYYTPKSVTNILFIEGDPNNYPCGCVATVMAQLMRYHRYPQAPVELQDFTIWVDGRRIQRSLLGGAGANGAYNFNDMVLVPGPGTTDRQRRAIGAICHDAGVAVGMQYWFDGSGAYLYDAATAMVDTFQFAGAVWAENGGNVTWGQDLTDMINPNLDAGLPVFLGFRNSFWLAAGHAAICDGYGYNFSTPYHHLNMGWNGQDDCWYSLPDISLPDKFVFDVITRCIYNIMPQSTGEIISGRIIDPEGRGFEDVQVTARNKNGTDVHTARTNSRGIYAITNLNPDSAYAVSASEYGYDFYLSKADDSRLDEVTTGSSDSGNSSSGNKWGVNFVGYENCRTITVGTQALEWDYPMHTEYHDSRTQAIYLAEEIGAGGTITALALDITRVPGGALRNWTIRMKHTAAGEYGTCSLSAAGWTTVYRGNETIQSTGWRQFEFQTPFEYNGTDNLLVDFSHNDTSANRSGVCRASRPGGARSVYAASNSEHQDPLHWPSGEPPQMQCSDNVPNVRLSLCRESQIVRGDMKLTASDGRTGDHFGCSVAISGDYAIVGAYGNNSKSGAAYIFNYDGTHWIEQAKLRVLGDDYFGCSVSISGDHAVVGTTGTHIGANPVGSYRAYVFKREGTAWTRQTELRRIDVAGHDYYASSVSISGDYAIVGAPGHDEEIDGTMTLNLGAICLFEREGPNWIQQTRLMASDPLKGDYFGDSVMICGDYIITAGGNSSRGTEAFGPVYILTRDGDDWVQRCKLNSLSTSFGSSIAISEDYAVIGAPDEDNDDGLRSGTAHLFKRNGTNWTQQPKLIGMDSEALDFFGSAVAISGDYIAVGACNDDGDDYYRSKDAGSVYVFKRDGSGFRQHAKLSAFDGGYDDHFGGKVAIDGKNIIISAEGDGEKGKDSGSVYIFTRVGEVWVP